MVGVAVAVVLSAIAALLVAHRADEPDGVPVDSAPGSGVLRFRITDASGSASTTGAHARVLNGERVVAEADVRPGALAEFRGLPCDVPLVLDVTSAADAERAAVSLVHLRDATDDLGWIQTTPPASLRVRVVGQRGEPVPGASVAAIPALVQPQGYSAGRVATWIGLASRAAGIAGSVTDGTGCALLEGLPRAELSIRVAAPDRAVVAVVADTRFEESIAVQQPDAADVRVHVLDAAGRPVREGVRVSAAGPALVSEPRLAVAGRDAFTDSDGTARLTGLQPGEFVVFVASGAGDALVPRGRFRCPVTDPVEVVDAGDARVLGGVHVPSGSGVASGDAGRILVEAEYLASGVKWCTSVATDVESPFVVTLPAPANLVRVTARVRSAGLNPCLDEPLTVCPGASVRLSQPIEFPATRRYHLDLGRSLRRPRAADVQFLDADGIRRAQTIADEAGRVAFDVPEGVVEVRATQADGEWVQFEIGRDADADDASGTVMSDPAHGPASWRTVRVTVQHDGVPVRAAAVAIRRLGWTTSVFTDATGSALVRVGPEPTVLSCAAPQGFGEAEIDAPPGSATVPAAVAIRLTRAPRARVDDAPALLRPLAVLGRAGAGSEWTRYPRVRFSAPDPGTLIAYPTRLTERASPDPEERCILVDEGPEAGGLRAVLVATDGDQLTSTSMRPAQPHVQVRVLDGQRPLAGARCELAPESVTIDGSRLRCDSVLSPSLSLVANADTDGVARFDRVLPGVYRVTARVGDLRYLGDCVVERSTGEEPVSVHCVQSCRLRIVLAMADGSPVPACELSLSRDVPLAGVRNRLLVRHGGGSDVFVEGVRAGTHFLHLGPAFGAAQQFCPQSIRGIDPVETAELNVVLDPGELVHGRVQPPHGPAGVEESIAFEPVDHSHPWRRFPIAGSGEFDARGLRPGEYHVRVLDGTIGNPASAPVLATVRVPLQGELTVPR